MQTHLCLNSLAVTSSLAFSFLYVEETCGKPISALQKLKAVGITTSALICPVIPYITDVNPLIDMLAPHTNKFWIYGLSILNRSDQNWQNVDSILEGHFPGLKERIRKVVFSRGHSYWEKLRKELVQRQNDDHLNLRIHV